MKENTFFIQKEDYCRLYLTVHCSECCVEKSYKVNIVSGVWWCVVMCGYVWCWGDRSRVVTVPSVGDVRGMRRREEGGGRSTLRLQSGQPTSRRREGTTKVNELLQLYQLIWTRSSFIYNWSWCHDKKYFYPPYFLSITEPRGLIFQNWLNSISA